jgi:hypothetical protein
VHRDLRLLDAGAAVAPVVLRWAIELARADHGAADAMAQARAAWAEMVPPHHVAADAASTPTAARLR